VRSASVPVGIAQNPCGNVPRSPRGAEGSPGHAQEYAVPQGPRGALLTLGTGERERPRWLTGQRMRGLRPPAVPLSALQQGYGLSQAIICKREK